MNICPRSVTVHLMPLVLSSPPVYAISTGLLVARNFCWNSWCTMACTLWCGI